MHSISNNSQLVRDIKLCGTGKRLTVATNEGTKTFKHKAMLEDFEVPVFLKKIH